MTKYFSSKQVWTQDQEVHYQSKTQFQTDQVSRFRIVIKYK